jgi:hypothetical protein
VFRPDRSKEKDEIKHRSKSSPSTTSKGQKKRTSPNPGPISLSRYSSQVSSTQLHDSTSGSSEDETVIHTSPSAHDTWSGYNKTKDTNDDQSLIQTEIQTPDQSLSEINSPPGMFYGNYQSPGSTQLHPALHQQVWIKPNGERFIGPVQVSPYVHEINSRGEVIYFSSIRQSKQHYIN